VRAISGHAMSCAAPQATTHCLLALPCHCSCCKEGPSSMPALTHTHIASCVGLCTCAPHISEHPQHCCCGTHCAISWCKVPGWLHLSPLYRIPSSTSYIVLHRLNVLWPNHQVVLLPHVCMHLFLYMPIWLGCCTAVWLQLRGSLSSVHSCAQQRWLKLSLPLQPWPWVAGFAWVLVMT
jgi:hypothetical protein